MKLEITCNSRCTDPVHDLAEEYASENIPTWPTSDLYGQLIAALQQLPEHTPLRIFAQEALNEIDRRMIAKTETIDELVGQSNSAPTA